MATTRRQNPAKTLSRITADLKRLPSKTKHDKETASKSETYAVRAAIKGLDGRLKKLSDEIHTWGWFPRGK